MLERFGLHRPSARWNPVWVAVGVLVVSLLLHRFWLRELSHLTGPAEWIWVTDTLDPPRPVAGLFVASLSLARPPGEAVLKVCGDREYVVYVNGTVAACGWSRPGFRLDLFDVGHLLQQGANVIAVEVRSPTPVGGLLLSLDVDGVGSNVVTSGRSFVYRSSFSLAPPSGGEARVPVDWGLPPRFPWGYPLPVSHPRTLDLAVVEDPVRVPISAARPSPDGSAEIDLPSPTTGYVWLEFPGDGEAGVGFPKGGRIEWEPVVRLAGERRWLVPRLLDLDRIFLRGTCRPSVVEIWPVGPERALMAPGAEAP